ncbi:glycosyltransferase family 4 protein [Anabaena cylindrica FACHB-243]|uniref:Glycosyl transferase group 1 n=1 Tax=Anabaena cylindrica (strain ATCC 27899 / PCC 7122) TaxID=272123 RepID=K9Z9N9_ANACC|nr:MULTISPECIES: glycosyltransferase family 4 protein [Anabaena]AFZ55913.1 glycosyl transferase group 1 [Anabaena cylindrica PCC 7122]MBD2421336.1 glycosyltransferase family 4 protein [Anabaena cylindrica FACHB-243]MBY5282239.1 glycosyltransferase family 4 protein [Anabaena sp. CCAP 1446/1C]MBY5310460.1 glycosyltransferase family 4 protein [Anabaena sp. CCAP 1446/1C]MCM2406668.1 glycosyltransferase family 4 protein [Anabaena sp. CCAP 1446/1C]
MRILHITNHLQQIGNGIVNVAVDLACLQAKNGLHVAVASSGGQYEELLANHGIKHFKLDQSRSPLNMIKAAWRYREIIKKFQPDIVHTHMMTGVVLAGIFRNSGNYSLVSTVHNEFQRSAVLMGLADRVIAVSHAVADSMIRRGIPAKKLCVVANGTLGSPRHRNIQDYQPLALHHPAITTVAGMYSRKGIGDLIEAFSLIAQDFPHAHLYLVGDGPDRPIFEKIVQSKTFRDKGLHRRIHFEGFQAEPQRYMLSTDIFVLASHCESFGLVLTEAREAGCAIIASDVDGIPETLDHRQAGILVPPQDSQTLANALGQLLSDSQQLQKWKFRAQQNLERFSAARVNQETLTVYSELMRKYNVPKVMETRELVAGKKVLISSSDNY